MRTMNIEEILLFEDKDLLVCRKPAGVPVQTKKFGSMDMESGIRNYLAAKGENPYVAVIHRLDQPVEGILVFGKNPKAAKNLNQQMQQGKMDKYYLAAVCGTTENKKARLENELVKDGKNNCSYVVEKKRADSKKAVLEYEILKEEFVEKEQISLARIHLLTGRHHQIRVQMAYVKMPLWGDTKYNEKPEKKEWQQIALCAYQLQFYHPATGKKMKFEVEPGSHFPIRP